MNEKSLTYLDILKKLDVLYVEDEDEIRESLSPYIKRRVANLHVAKNGIEGLEVFKKTKPHIVITDINMPEMHGFKMADEIRALSENIPIIFTTAHNEKQFIEKSKKLYSNSYLVKPFEYKDLDLQFKTLIESHFKL